MPIEKLPDSELLDALQLLAADYGIMLRTCRSGVKLELGFCPWPEGSPPLHTMFGGPEFEGYADKRPDVLPEGAVWFPTEQGRNALGGDVRALLTKMVLTARKLGYMR